MRKRIILLKKFCLEVIRNILTSLSESKSALPRIPIIAANSASEFGNFPFNKGALVRVLLFSVSAEGSLLFSDMSPSLL